MGPPEGNFHNLSLIDYPALHGHFIRASQDVSRSSSERAKFQGLATKLGTVSFLKDLAVMKDMLRELSYLSLKIQSRTCNIVKSYEEVKSTIAVVRALIIAGGGKSSKKVACIDTTYTFKGVPLTVGKAGINASQFMTAVLDSLTRRTVSSPSPLLLDLQKLYKVNWPPAESDELILFGEEEVSRLAKRLNLPTRTIVESFRKYKAGGKPSPDLTRLLVAAETYPGSTAECERCFSVMNETVWDRRNKLSIQAVSNLMFIRLNGVSVADFNPIPYVQSWLAAGNRPSTASITGRKAAEKSDIHQTLIHNSCV